ncbi:MAG: class I SAM-dependent methyltransferase [Candidatus Bathyarchaeota archaeon]|nr:class I SAM-dependent methyltransferase [Candidatus Bathyarchaeota archaeon]
MSFREYVQNLSLEQLFRRLKAPNPALLAGEVEYFTVNEAEERDRRVLSYLGEDGINQIINTIYEFLFAPPKLPANAKVLDVGAGTGFFTVKLFNMARQKLPNVRFYAMDATPAMLISLSKKSDAVTPFVGIAENIRGSIKEAGKHFSIPRKFDAVFSTLMLHHSPEPEKVFQSIKEVLKSRGKAIIVDLCKHDFEEFRTEMGDVHLGFNLESISEMACRYFPKVKINEIRGARCECSKRSAEMFAAFMKR